MSDSEGDARKKRYREYLNSELEAAALYTALSRTERDASRVEVFERLVDAEMRHAARWAEKLGIDPKSLEPKRHGLRFTLLRWSAALFGTGRVLPIVLRAEDREVSTYAADPEAQDLVQEERRHARDLRGMARTAGPGGVWNPLGVAGRGGNLRAAVLGVNDGLVSNFSLVMGVAGGTDNADFILLAGVAGLLAGAFSMAAGEYVSMRSQREVYEKEIRREEAELREWPEEEEEELVLIYQTKGLSADESRRIAKRLMADPKVALDTMAREELGLDPSQLGSPWGASFSSFFSFLAGAVVPIVPYVFGEGNLALSLSASLSAIALLLVGGLLALVAGRNAVWGAFRMLLAGCGAAAVTYGVGSLIGIAASDIV